MYFEKIDSFQGSENQDEGSGKWMRRYTAPYPAFHEGVIAGVDNDRVSLTLVVVNSKCDEDWEFVDCNDKYCFIFEGGTRFVIPGLRQPTGMRSLGLRQPTRALVK
jgi:hypothetical protein